MNQKVFLITPLAFLLLLLVACGGKKTNQETMGKERAFQSKTDTIEMQSSLSKGNVLFKGNEYRYEIERIACDSLPMVKDEEGNVFVDNCVRLTITRNGNRPLISKVFTKKTFMNDVPSKFMKEAILEGFVFYEERMSDEDGIVFAASVCIPQTDLFYPLIVRVSSDGGIRVEPDNIMMEIMDGVIEEPV